MSLTHLSLILVVTAFYTCTSKIQTRVWFHFPFLKVVIGLYIT